MEESTDLIIEEFEQEGNKLSAIYGQAGRNSIHNVQQGTLLKNNIM